MMEENKNETEKLNQESESSENFKEKKSRKDKKLLERIEQLESEVNEWKTKFYSAYADCDNLRKSYEKDHQMMIKYRASGFLEALLPIFDSFHMALMVKPNDPALENYFKGFEMIYRQLLNALESEGVKEISPEIGSDFSVDSMQAIEVRESDSENKVLQVFSKGYFLKDRLIRPAMVAVSKLKKEKDETDSLEVTEEAKTIN